MANINKITVKSMSGGIIKVFDKNDLMIVPRVSDIVRIAGASFKVFKIVISMPNDGNTDMIVYPVSM